MTELRERSQRTYDLYHKTIEEFLADRPDESREAVERELVQDREDNRTIDPYDSKYIAYWDLETMGLNPATMPLLCATIQNGVGKVYTKSRRDFDDPTDKSLALWVRNRLERYGTLAGYNSKGFDVLYLNERLRRHRMRPLRLQYHVDIMLMVPRSWPKRSLDYVSSRLGLQDGEVYKSGYHEPTWVAAANGDAESMAFIVKHNVDDVELTRRVYEKFVQARDGTE